MSILAECPYCRKKQSVKNRVCTCGADLMKAKGSQRVRYWINYRMPDGKQRREPVGFSIEEAKDADGKRRSQKRENRIFDILPESKITFDELAEWYLNLKSTQKLSSYNRSKLALDNFNKALGSMKVCQVKMIDLENYQADRLDQGRAAATVDMEIKIMQTAVTKAFDNDMIDGGALKAFRSLKRQLKKGTNARRRIISFNEYDRLVSHAPPHLKYMIIVGFNTGMRMGEIRNLQWKMVDRKNGFIRLPKESTKEAKKKIIPINHHVESVLKEIPRSINHDYVFTYLGKPISQKDGTKRSLSSTCEKAGIPYGRKTENGITFHDVRRTAKTNMLNSGMDRAHRDVILGHSLQGMDAHYLVPDETELKKAMEKFTRWLDEQLLKQRLLKIWSTFGQQMAINNPCFMKE